MFGVPSFAVAGPCLWNILLCDPELTVLVFYQLVKMHLIAYGV